MALSQHLLTHLLGRDWWDALDVPHRIPDQHFALGLTEDDLLGPLAVAASLYPPSGRRPSPSNARPRWLIRRPGSGVSEVSSDPDKFQVMLDVRHFTPDEIEVKTVDNSVVISAQHEERPDEHGFVSRQFMRRYILPEGVEPENITSTLTSDGILKVEAPRKRPEEAPGNTRIVPIQVQHTAPTAVTEGAKPKQQKDASTNGEHTTESK